jgi:hypothetical protein
MGQMVVAVLITANYLINCFNFQLMSGEGSPARKVFDILDVIFNVIFLIELL